MLASSRRCDSSKVSLDGSVGRIETLKSIVNARILVSLRWIADNHGVAATSIVLRAKRVVVENSPSQPEM